MNTKFINVVLCISLFLSSTVRANWTNENTAQAVTAGGALTAIGGLAGYLAMRKKKTRLKNLMIALMVLGSLTAGGGGAAWSQAARNNLAGKRSASSLGSLSGGSLSRASSVASGLGDSGSGGGGNRNRMSRSSSDSSIYSDGSEQPNAESGLSDEQAVGFYRKAQRFVRDGFDATDSDDMKQQIIAAIPDALLLARGGERIIYNVGPYPVSLQMFAQTFLRNLVQSSITDYKNAINPVIAELEETARGTGADADKTAEILSFWE